MTDHPTDLTPAEARLAAKALAAEIGARLGPQITPALEVDFSIWSHDNFDRHPPVRAIVHHAPFEIEDGLGDTFASALSALRENWLRDRDAACEREIARARATFAALINAHSNTSHVLAAFGLLVFLAFCIVGLPLIFGGA